MTVAELIEELEKMDSNMEVLIDTGDGFCDVDEVTSDEQGDVTCYLILGTPVEVDDE